MSNLPKSALLTQEHMALFVDYYELTMGQADLDSIITLYALKIILPVLFRRGST